MQCSPIRGIFCHSCCFPNQLLSKKSCKRLRQSKETYKALFLVTPRMKLQDIWITPIWDKIWSNCDTRYSSQLPNLSLRLSVRGDEWMYFSFLLNMKVKSAPLLMGQNAYAEKGGLPHSSDTPGVVGALGAPVLVLTGYFLPEDFKEAHLTLQRSKKHERAKELGEETEGSVADL